MNGKLVDKIRAIPGENTLLYKMLDGVTSVESGVWVNVRGYRLRTIDISGISDASVEIRESTRDIASALPNSEDGSLVGSRITADCSKVWMSSSTWVKVTVPAYVSGTITVFLNVDRSST